jgi:MoxR-like ATPase
MEETTSTVVEVSEESLQDLVASPKKRTRKPKIVQDESVSDTSGIVEEAVPEQIKFDIVKTFNKNHIKVLQSAISLNTPALLVGHTGLGKTTLIKELANQNNKTLIRLSVHSGVTADEILGKWLAEAGSTVWQDGLLVQAMKQGHWIVFDEINACPADVMFALHSLLDDDRHITLLEKKGEVVKPHAEFRFFATMNPQEDYAGTKELNMAFLSRFNAVIEIEPYEASVEVSILESKGVQTAIAQELVASANKLREMKKIDEIMYFCGTRDIINTALLTNSGLTLKEAIKYGIMNKMSPDDRQFVGNKIPDLNFKTKDQLEIERLGQQITTDYARYTEESRVKDATINALHATVQSVQKELDDAKANGGGGNAKLDPDTLRALKILKVLK